MHWVDDAGHGDPAINLALEEYLMRRSPIDADILLFYVNDQAVVIGRNQVPFAEVGLQALQRRRTTLVRRISGGGAVYHDVGNLNFSWIQTCRNDPFPSPTEALAPVRQGLLALGLPVHLNARHDILLKDRKITGVAQYRTKDKCMTHGTLLVSADLEALAELLQPDADLPISRGRRSVPSQVTNITRHRPSLTIADLKDALLQAFAALHGPLRPLSIEESVWAEIHQTARAKYRSWDWTVGRSPKFAMRRRAALAWGACEAVIHIQHGIITRVETTLPIRAPSALTALAEHLRGERYHPAAVGRRVRAALTSLDVSSEWRRLAEWLCPSWAGWG
jgi:lipoate-protein ligase A